MYSQNDYRSYGELYHHGVLGQKHGVRNGPPYPLDAEDHSASEKKAGWHKSLDGGSGSDKKKVSRPETVAERKNRIETGIKEANKADKLDAKAFKALDKGKYDKAEKLFDKSASINKLAQAKLADASFDEIQLGERFLREKKSMIVATVIGTALAGPIGGAASGVATYAVNAVSKEGRLARKMQREIDAENREKYLKEKEAGKRTAEEESAKHDTNDTTNDSKPTHSTREDAVKAAQDEYKDRIARAGMAPTESAVREAYKSADADYAKRMKEIDSQFGKTSSSGNGYSKSDKQRLLKDAREKDQYDLNFLEATQNVEESWSNKKRVEEYSKYLDDPEKYWKNRT